MQKFIVKALSVGGLKNQIFNSGDVVCEENFPQENIAELVEKGFLVPIDNTQIEKKDKVEIRQKLPPEKK